MVQIPDQEDLVLQGLAAKQPFEVAYPLLQPAQLGGRNNLIICANRFTVPLPSSTASSGTPGWARAMAAGNITDRDAGLHRLGNHGQLQIRREAPPMCDAGDHFDLRERVEHRRMPKVIPRPSD
jgi:hypothetical protein